MADESIGEMRERILREILGRADKVLTDPNRDDREKQRWSRIAVEAINALGKIKDSGPTQDDLASLLEKLRETEDGKRAKKEAKKGESDS